MYTIYKKYQIFIYISVIIHHSLKWDIGLESVWQVLSVRFHIDLNSENILETWKSCTVYWNFIRGIPSFSIRFVILRMR